jgi:hypothetical protein
VSTTEQAASALSFNNGAVQNSPHVHGQAEPSLSATNVVEAPPLPLTKEERDAAAAEGRRVQNQNQVLSANDTDLQNVVEHDTPGQAPRGLSAS